jgi:hypothetical protein
MRFNLHWAGLVGQNASRRRPLSGPAAIVGLLQARIKLPRPLRTCQEAGQGTVSYFINTWVVSAETFAWLA